MNSLMKEKKGREKGPDCDRWPGPKAISHVPIAAALPVVMASVGQHRDAIFLFKYTKSCHVGAKVKI